MKKKTASDEPPFAALVAFDWADQQHSWSLAVPGEKERAQGVLMQTPEAIDAWVKELITRFAGQPIAVCLEQKRGALLFCLSKYPQLVLYPIHPATAKDYRKALYPSGRKSDPVDAEVLLEFLATHRAHLRVWQPAEEQTRELQFLVEDRRGWVAEQTACRQRLEQRLKMSFPQALGWFGATDSTLLWEVLAHWPDLASLQAAGREALAGLLPTDKRRRAPAIDQLWPAIRQAVAITHDAAVLRSAARLVEALVDQLRRLRVLIGEYETRIDALTRAHPDYALMSSFPGVGQALAPRLIAAVGTDRARFADAGELQCYSGIAPVEKASGKSCRVHMRRACSRFVRQSFFEWAQHSIPHSVWARATYDELRARGKTHAAAVRALAFKWIRIFYRCWLTRTLYDEATHLAQRARQAQCPPVPNPVRKPCIARTAFSLPG